MTNPEFTQWQQMECARLGLTVEEHNEILEICDRIHIPGIGGTYDFVTNLLVEHKTLGDLENLSLIDNEESQ